MTGRRWLPRWLRVGLLLGSPMALGVFTTTMIGDRLRQNCSATVPPTLASWVLIAASVTGAAIAGWWASQGMRAGYGCLAGLLFGLLVDAGVIAASMVDLELQVNCLTPPLQENLRPHFTSTVIQSAISFALELAGLAGLAGFLAARYRRKPVTEPRLAKPQPAPWGQGPSHTTPPASFVRGLDFELEVGEAERHRVHFHWNQFWGISEIDVDGRKVIRKVRPFEVAITKRYRFTVGEREHHEVLIEKKRPLLYAGFRPQVVRVFIDGQFVSDYTS